MKASYISVIEQEYSGLDSLEVTVTSAEGQRIEKNYVTHSNLERLGVIDPPEGFIAVSDKAYAKLRELKRAVARYRHRQARR